MAVCIIYFLAKEMEISAAMLKVNGPALELHIL